MIKALTVYENKKQPNVTKMKDFNVSLLKYFSNKIPPYSGSLWNRP